MGVIRRSKDFVSIDRDVSLDPVAVAASPSGRLRPLGTILPDQISSRGVQRLNDAARVRQVHDAVVDKWRSFLSAGVVHRPGPGELKLLDVPRVDLIERAVPPGVVGAPPVEPIARSGVAQHGLGYRAEILHLCREPKARQQNADGNRKNESPRHRAVLLTDAVRAYHTHKLPPFWECSGSKEHTAPHNRWLIRHPRSCYTLTSEWPTNRPPSAVHFKSTDLL